MTAIFAKQALLPDGWHQNVRISLDDGKIGGIAISAPLQKGDHTVGALLPALPNLHSHTFQRAMAGMTEKRGPGADSFWTWRELMYRFLQHLTPDDIESIAAFTFMEMQEAGFGSVAEFHYLHNAAGGTPYANRAELSARIMSAAKSTGIGLTLLPVLYTYAGLGKKALADKQLRFKNDISDYHVLHGEAATIMARSLQQDSRMGTAPHSLRAVAAEDLAELSETLPDMPFHLHIAEQVAEVDEVAAAYGLTPVAWLLRNATVTRNWCLIHATHMTSSETEGLARTGAVAGLCPVTEANLGDGIFNGAQYLASDGQFGVGTDSNINVSVTGELCMLEYSQRLLERQRNVLASGNISTGTNLYNRAAAGGAQALGRSCGAIEIGMWADLVALEDAHLQLCALKPEQMLDGWIFASNQKLVTDVWSAGRHCVAQGRHLRRDAIEAEYRKTVTRLASLL